MSDLRVACVPPLGVSVSATHLILSCLLPATTIRGRAKPKALFVGCSYGCMGNTFDLKLLLNVEHLDHEERVHEAAAVLGSMKAGFRQRRATRRYTGIVDGRRRAVGQLLKLPNGHVVKLLAASRGRAFVTWEDLTCIHSTQLAEVDASLLRSNKHPAAVLLGTMKKGKKERRSRRKASSARRNGSRPCRPGRKRGRPRVHSLECGTWTESKPAAEM